MLSFLTRLRLYIAPKIVYKSKDGRIVVQDSIEYGRPVRLLLYNGIRESGIYLDENRDQDPLFFYMQTLKEVIMNYMDIKEALLIGGGGFAFPRYYRNVRPEGGITVVEKDDSVYALAKKYFFLSDDPGIEVVIQDGIAFIADSARKRAMGQGKVYDIIIFDAFEGNNVPKGLLSENTYKLVKQLLHPDGILAINVINEKDFVPSMQAELAIAQLKSVFRNTQILSCRRGWNSIILASERKLGKESHKKK